jgi:peptidyl-prolyl cis-trans isomerase D
MLYKIRKNLRAFSLPLWIVAASFVGTIFLVWGRGGLTGPSASQVATVNGEGISVVDFNREVQAVERELQSQFGEDFRKRFPLKEIKRIALQRLIQRELLLQLAEKEGLQVSDWAVAKAIEEMPIFQENGKFSIKLYKEFLKAQGLTPETFENEVRKDLLVQKVLTVVNHAPSVTKAELLTLYKKSFGEREIGYKVFKPSDFNPQVSPEEVEKYYETHKEEFAKEGESRFYVLKFKNDQQGKLKAQKAYRLAKEGKFKELLKLGAQPLQKESLKKKLKEKPFLFKSEGDELLLAFKVKEKNYLPLSEVKEQIVKKLKEEKGLKLASEAARSYKGELKVETFTPQEFYRKFKPVNPQAVDQLFTETPSGKRVILTLSGGVGVFEPKGELKVGKVDQNQLLALKLLVLGAKEKSDLQELLTLLAQKATVKLNPQYFPQGGE